MTCKDMIISKLKNSPPLAVHEFHLGGYSENNIATRLSELAKQGHIKGQFRKGAAFKEWFINEDTGHVSYQTDSVGQMSFIIQSSGEARS